MEGVCQTPVAVVEPRVRDLMDLLARGGSVDVIAWFGSYKPVDVASVASALADDELKTLIEALPSAEVASLLEDGDDALRMRVTRCLEDPQLLAVLGRMHNDDAADLLALIDPARSGALLAGMRGADRAVLTSLLRYPAESCGSLMTTYLWVRETATVADCVRMLHDSSRRTEQVQTTYVLDARSNLVGYVDLRDILTSARDAGVSTIMKTAVISIEPYADQEEAAKLVARYNLNALPVVSGSQLLGVITVDDVIDVIISEYDEDLLGFAGASREERLGSPLRDSVRMRLPWLAVNLVTAFAASTVVKLFEGTIEQVVALSAIMTVVSGMGGNAGSQTMAIVVRHLSRGEVGRREVVSGVVKELAAGALDGLAIGLVTAAVVLPVYGSVPLAVVALAAIVCNMMIAGTFGFIVPVVLARLGQDPAVASSIFVTTATDVLGFMIFLGLAQLALPLLL